MNTNLTIETPKMPAPHVRERAAFGTSGLPVLGLVILAIIASIVLFVTGVRRIDDAAGGSSASGVAMLFIGVLMFVATMILRGGLIVVAPGEARVLQFFGRYIGTERTDGLRWVVPFTSRQRISTRIRNHETDVTKVNDLDGNPIEIAAV